MVSTFEIQKSLQNVLAEHPITVKTYSTKDELIIVLNQSMRKPNNYETVTQLGENQLIDWEVNGIKKLKTFGKNNHQNAPLWQQVIDLTANWLSEKSNYNLIYFKNHGKLLLDRFKILTSKKL